MREGRINAPSRAATASRGPDLLRSSGNIEGESEAICKTINIAAGKSGGKRATICLSTCTPPAEAPTTMIFFNFAPHFDHTPDVTEKARIPDWRNRGEVVSVPVSELDGELGRACCCSVSL